MKSNLSLLFLLIQCLSESAVCDPDVGIGYQVTLDIPPAFTVGFVGRAFLMETDRRSGSGPSFRTALTVEAMDGDDEYSCSLDVFLGDVRVWSSGHFNRFRTADKCSVELTGDGDLQLVGQKGRVGWRSGTSGQGVQRLNLLRSGNLVLVDSSNSIKWQTFNFPTDIMLWGQRLSSRTRLTSFVTATTFFTFEVQYDKIALFLNAGKLKYSYWEFRPPVGEHNITYVELTSDSLEIYNGDFRKVAEISSSQNPAPEPQEPVRFLALENATGNLALYYYSPEKSGFRVSFKALNTTCDHPLACDPYGICTFSQQCSCISLVNGGGGGGTGRRSSRCSSNISGGGCGAESPAMMVELKGVTSVLRGAEVVNGANVSKEKCDRLCLSNCSCAAAMYSTDSSCLLYDLVRGIKQVDDGSGGNALMIKVPRGIPEGWVRDRNSGLKPWAAILIGVGDGLLILIVVGGIAYYFIWKRRRSFEDTGESH